MKAADYDYQSGPISRERRDEIIGITDSLRHDAAHDIDDKREIYEALIDLLDVASLGVCRENHELRRGE